MASVNQGSSEAASGRTLLSAADIDNLLAEPSAEARAGVAIKVANSFDPGALGEQERVIARDILGILARDAAVRVRAALSDALQANPHVPREVALRLARDVAEVAVPMLETSVVFSDDDLVAIIEGTGDTHRRAIARRPEVAESVADALVAKGDEDVVSMLMSNAGARIGERALHVALDRFGDSPRVNEPIVHRGDLPITVSERLVTLVSDSLRQHLVMHHDLPDDMAADLVLQSRERALVALLAESGNRDVAVLVRAMHASRRLTPTLILRVLCTGDLAFFETALATIAGIPIVNARALIHDAGGRGLRALWARCGLPDQLLPMAQAAVEVIAETQYDGGPADRARFVERVIERIVTRFEEPPAGDDIDWLIDRMSRALAAKDAALEGALRVH